MWEVGHEAPLSRRGRVPRVNSQYPKPNRSVTLLSLSKSIQPDDVNASDHPNNPSDPGQYKEPSTDIGQSVPRCGNYVVYP